MAPAIQHNPRHLSDQYLGPRALETVKKRYTAKFSDHQAPSYVPTEIYLDAREKLDKPVETWIKRRPVDKSLWKDILPDLQNHIDCRIQLIFQQFMLVYRTGLAFRFYNKADYQAGGDKMSGAEGNYVGAHDSTLPCLRLAQKEHREDSISFAKNSFYYWLWNMVTYLPRTANQVDSTIDYFTEIEGKTLREHALKLLNQVAAGDKNPLHALDDFLAIFLRVLDAARKKEKDPEKAWVLDVYADTAKIYYNFKKDGSPLAKWLCFFDASVDESFYMTVQGEMHQLLGKQMRDLKPLPIKIPDFPAHISWTSLNNSVQETILKGVHHPTETSAIYTKAGLLSNNVRAAALDFLIALHPLSPSEREKKLSAINHAREASFFKSVVLHDIAQNFYVSDPQNMNAILLFILEEVALRLAAGSEEDRAPAPAAIEEQKENEIGLAPPPTSLNGVKGKIRELTKDSKQTETVKKSLKTCQIDAVRQVAKKYLIHLSALSDELQTAEFAKIQRITTSSQLSAVGLSEKASEVYWAVCNQIISKKLPKPTSTMPRVLLHLFADVIKEISLS